MEKGIINKTNKTSEMSELYEINKNLEISELCKIYNKFLTPKQAELLDEYYNEDFSLAEIADNHNITRQAVRDNIKNAEKKLYEMEEKLDLLKYQKNQNAIELQRKKRIEKIKKELSKIKTEDKEDINIIEKIKQELNLL